MTRSLRHIAAWAALAAMLFAQVCLAVYACPLELPTKATAAAMVPDCHGDGAPSSDATCDTHCNGSSASPSAAPTPTLAILDAVPLIVAMPDMSAAGCSAPGDDIAATAAAPPAAIRFCRFLN